ncbi:MAG: hypothetical protein ACRDZ3_15105, partial [Acidimicrobiia bacterium]
NASDPPPRRGIWFWAGLVLGWAVMAFGLAGLMGDAADTHPGDLARWFVSGVLTHDALVAPAVCGAGWLLARVVPRAVRGPVTSGLVLSGVVALYAWPFLRGYGLRPDNPSALPLDYAAGLTTVLALVWVACGALALRCWRRTRAAP